MILTLMTSILASPFNLADQFMIHLKTLIEFYYY